MTMLIQKAVAGPLLFTAIVLAFCLPGPTAYGEDPIATELDVSEAKDFVGKWKIAMDLMGRELSMFLTFADVGGKMGATLDSVQQPEALAIAQIAKAEEGGLELNSELKFGSFSIDITIFVDLGGEGLTGRISDKGGLFKSDIVGTPLTEEDLDLVQGRRPSPTEARLRFADKLVRISFANLNMDHEDFNALGRVEEGEIYSYTSSRATKMYTDANLVFGDTVIKAGNMAENYPGVYSLWLKRVENGWALVFNEEADTWGTRHEPSADVAQIPLTLNELDEEAEKFLVQLEREGDGGLLKVSWGSNLWTAKFTVGQ